MPPSRANSGANDFKNLQRFIRALSHGGLQRIAESSIEKFSGDVAQRIRKGYLGKPQSSNRITWLGQEHGKHAGDPESKGPLPAKPIIPAAMRGLKYLAGGVKRSKVTGGMLIHMNPKERHPADRTKLLSLIAYWAENPKKILIPVTYRMAVYLRLLNQGKAGIDTPKPNKHIKDNENRILRVVVYEGKPAGVWAAAIEYCKQASTIQKWGEHIASKINKLARRFGGKASPG